MKILDGLGNTKGLPGIFKGMIIPFEGTIVPAGWQLLDSSGAIDLTDRVLVCDTATGVGSSGGTEAADALTHSGFALTNHSDHVVTQPSAHSAHTATQPDAHSNHVATQPSAHTDHSSDGGHTHDAHGSATTGGAAVAGTKLTGPSGTHSSDGGHTHDAHSAHSGSAVDAHSAHTGFAVDAHSAHSGMTVDSHSAHGVTQASNHALKVARIAFLMKI